jgi:2-succinyl-6-hydroxy-2,4-cyclohexadiene-1-carboxylate synthase
MTPLVFLHGFTGSPRSFGALSAETSLGQRLYAPPLLGHEPTLDYRILTDELCSAPPETRWDRELDRLAELLRAAALDAVHLWGYSLGARLSLGLALRHPELVSRLTLISGQPGLEDAREREHRRAADETWCRQLENEGTAAFAEAWQAQPLFASQNALPRELCSAQARERLAHSAQGLALSLRTVGLAEMPNYWPKLASLTLPVDLVAGALDEKFHALAVRTQRELPNATLHVVRDSGHNVLLERPNALFPLLRAAA